MGSADGACVVRSLADVDRDAWDALVGSSGDSTPFHSLGWAAAVCSLPRTRVLAHIVKEDGAYAAAALTAVTERGPLRTVSSLPFGTYGGLLVASGADRARCAEHVAASLARDMNAWTTVDVTDWSGTLERRFPRAQSRLCATRVLVLDEPYPRIASGRFEPAVRQKIRQAERAGVRVVRGHAEDRIEAFLRLARATYARHASTAPPGFLYAAAVRAMAPRGEALLSTAVLADGAEAGMALHLRAGAHVFNWLTAIDPRHAHHRPANALIDDAIRWAYESQSTVYNFGSTPDGSPGVEAFKKAWGAVPRTYATLRIDGTAMRVLRAARHRLAKGGG